MRMAALRSFQVGVLPLFVALAVLMPSSHAEAAHDKFAYKFPCRPMDACYLTQLEHGTNALDIDPKGSAGLGDIVAVSEGVFVGYYIQSPTCNELGGAGKYAVVSDMFDRTLVYAHLSRFGGFEPGQRVIQGASIGREGDTGHTHWFPGGVHTPCAAHLHLGGITTASYIDGHAISSLRANPSPYRSTNSAVGAYNVPGAAILGRYMALGDVYTSWAVVGWAADRSFTNAGCDVPHCRLHVHYVPDPASGHWGSRQEFRRHPQGLSTFSAIMAGRWDPARAYWVQATYYSAWIPGGTIAGTGERRPIGIPLMDRINGYPGLCERTAGCAGYQRFHLGYIWEPVGQGPRAVFCPDVSPGFPNQDYSVSMSDLLAVVGRFGRTDTVEPYASWPDAWYDINGDGTVAMSDAMLVLDGFGVSCVP